MKNKYQRRENSNNIDWRKKIYLNQRKINATPTHSMIMPATVLKPNLLTLLLVLSLVPPLVGRQNQHVNHSFTFPSSEEVPTYTSNNATMNYQQQHAQHGFSFFAADNNSQLRQLIDFKLKPDKRLTAQERKNLRCEIITETIVNTTRILSHTSGAILRVLMDDTTKLICTTSELIQQDNRPSAAAYLDIESGSLFFSPEGIEEGLVNHEFIHADSYIRHKGGLCKTDHIEDAVLPLFPPSIDNIEMYWKGLDKGDQRLKNFKNLWQKMQKSKLSPEELDIFEKYLKASKDCCLTYMKDTSNLQAYDHLLKLGWYPGLKGFKLTKEGVTMEIIEVTKNANNLVILLRHTDPAQTVMGIIDKVKNKLNGSYKDLPGYLKLVERDAFTFEHLSEQAIKTFYPEAAALREKDIQKCYQPTSN